VGYPKVINGSTLLRRLAEALLTLIKVPLFNCLSLKILKILTLLGLSLFTPLILTTNANLDSAGTKIWPVSLALISIIIYISSGVDFSSLGCLVLGFVLLSSFCYFLSSCLVWSSSVYSLLLKSSCNLLISLLFFFKSLWFRNYDFLSCHYHKINIKTILINYY
jgi:hypothetical protein